MEDELLWWNTGQGPVAQGVVKLAVSLQLSQTTPSVAKHQDSRQVTSGSDGGTTVVNIHLFS